VPLAIALPGLAADRSGSDQVDHNVDIAACCFGYGHVWCASSTRAWATSRSTARQADLEASLEEVSVVSQAPVDFGVDAHIGRQRDFSFAQSRWHLMALTKQADQPAANSCSGLVPMRTEPGVESLMSRRPSELRETPFS
jgi:hypothetical protein